MANYDLRYFNQRGERIGDLNTAIEFEYGRTKNDIGAASILIPGEYYKDDFFQKDNILEIWRQDDTSESARLVGNTLWFLRKIEYKYEDKIETINLVFFDTISLIQRRVVAWYSLSPDDSFIDNDPSTFLQPLDDTLKMIFFHNFGEGAITPTLNTQAPVLGIGPGIPPSVEPTVRLMNVGLQPYQSLGPVERTDFAWKNCLEAMQDVVKVSESFNVSLWFDIEYIPGSSTNIGNLIFKTWTNLRGKDLTESVIFNPEYENMTNMTLIKDYTEEATIVYGIGEEDPDNNDGIEEVTTASVANIISNNGLPFYPIEFVHEADGDAAKIDPELIFSQVRGILAEKSPIASLTGEVIQHGNFLFFREYDYTDLVTITWKDLSFSAEITQFDVSVDSNGNEEIQIPIESSKFIEVQRIGEI